MISICTTMDHILYLPALCVNDYTLMPAKFIFLRMR